ncbi:MAG: MBL fold metallo-hydrolase [Candidatus Marinimicrobia bacterium]|nr:MBL fold metallo-hydrolase [Candidatus Neomarinimicrobiota bacterium]
MATLTFLGATGTVTGSKYLFEQEGSRFLLDCGLFQGLKELRLRNWNPLRVNLAKLDAVVLTHAHIDHTGYLPRLVRQGYHRPVYCTEPTRDLLEIMLLDSAHLQEEDAKYANKKGFSKHKPALPLYDTADAKKAISLLKGIPYETAFEVAPGIRASFRDAGHILGSAFAIVSWTEKDRAKRIVFSGDLGRPGRPVLRDPRKIKAADYLLLESTYGDRLHGESDPQEELKKIILKAVEKKGAVLIPAFAVGRTQELLYTLRALESASRIPEIPVYVDSPMAIRATRLYLKHTQIYDKEANALLKGGEEVLLTKHTEFTESVEASKRINGQRGPCIIISASGMLTGGRILHHLIQRLPDLRNTVVFVGYQAEGTRGRALQNGRDKVKIHGRYIKTQASIETISDFSAHADYREIMGWLKHFAEAPRKTFIVHGEPDASSHLQNLIRNERGWETHIPVYEEKIVLD